MAASKIKVKINNNEDTRLWRYSQEDDFDGLQSFITTSWKCYDFIAQYKDDEDDLITIASAQDLKDAFDFVRTESKKSLKIFVQTNVHQKRQTKEVPEEAPQEAAEEKSEPKEFNSVREMIVDFLTDESVLSALPQFFGAFVTKVTAALKARSGQLTVEEIAVMLSAELQDEQYRVITSHPLYVKFGCMAIPYIAHKVAAQQSLYPHFRTTTIQQWIQQMIGILREVLNRTAGGCFSFKDVVIDIEYPAMTDTGKVIHFGVECDKCGQYPIIGDRYKCAIREDYDLCEACEPQHDSPMIKFKKASKNHKNASFKGLTEIVRQLSGEPVARRVIQVPAASEMEMAKFVKMVQIGVPIHAVKQKMKLYNADPTLLDQALANTASNEVQEQVLVTNIMDEISGIDLYDENVPDCMCGAKMECVQGVSAYNGCSTVYCDGCNKRCWGMVYHCPNGKDSVHHPHGFDLCDKCGADKVKKVEQPQQDAEPVPVPVEPVDEVVVEDQKAEEQPAAEQAAKEAAVVEPVVEQPVEEQPKVDDFVYAAQLSQIKSILALESGERDEHIKTLLVQHKGDLSRVVPLLLD